MEAIKGINMLTRLIFLIVALQFYSIDLNAQGNSLLIEASELSCLDSIFIKMIDFHLGNTSQFTSMDDSSVIVMTILPVINSIEGVPQKLIDSIYKINEFPVTILSPMYYFIVETRPISSALFYRSQYFKSRFLFNYLKKTIIIESNLNCIFDCYLKKSVFKTGIIDDIVREHIEGKQYTVFRLNYKDLFWQRLTKIN